MTDGPQGPNQRPNADRPTAPLAASVANGEHGVRLKEPVRFTTASLETEFPSPFGCAIYDERDGALVTEAYDTVMAMCDPTNHAEINAIRAATRRLRRLSLRGCTLYSTYELCPMCMSACIWAEVETVVFGASTMGDANRYWLQASDMSPQELVSRMRIEPRCRIIPHVERHLCQELFIRCDEVRIKRGLKLPPHRIGGYETCV
jgi:tRNA(Arg) A34 adenosine deaminase TadA